MIKMLSLQDFEAPSFDDCATIGLVDGVPKYVIASNKLDETQPFYRYIQHYPEASITSDMFTTRESGQTIGVGDMFLPVQNSIFKKIVHTWREKGLIEAICLPASEDPERVTRVVHWIATRIKKTLDVIEKTLYQRDFSPTFGSGSVADFVTTRDWATSLVRCLAWHPHFTRFAVATKDDRIRIFSEGMLRTPLLKHSAQKSISCMSWRPYTGRELAVGCQSGILVWTIELGAASNSLSHALVLKQRNHMPVTSVTWHPEGDLLVSCSPMDLNMMIWDVSKEEGVALRRVDGGGLCFTRWSPCGAELFVATCRKVFRVWNTGTPTPWVADKWTVPYGRVAAACFGPNLTLLFTSDDDPGTIFSLPLQETIFDAKKSVPISDVKIAVPLVDLTKVSFPSDDESHVIVGGKVISMDWDPSGRYLAVLFQDSPWIALIKTKITNLSKVVEVEPCCLIKGYKGEVPNCMQFYQKYDPDGHMICLTVGWSSGRIQHIPMIHKNIQSDCSISFNTSLPSANQSKSVWL